MIEITTSMVSLIHTLKTKGFLNTIRRGTMIYSRYSFDRLIKSLSKMLDILENYDAKATFPITAVTLQRNIDVVKDINSRRIEWAMHGYVHIDYSQIDYQTIEEHIKKGKEVFSRAGLELYGFRAPYLSIPNMKNFSLILKNNGFIYDSSRSFFVDVIPLTKDVRLILDFYNPIKKWKVEEINGILEIPVSLPDDEILVDRLGYRSEKIGNIWIDMCEKIITHSGIPVLQLHPERGKICEKALSMVLDWARKNDIGVVTLRDIALGKRKKVMAITGDVDIIKISDLRAMNVGR